MTANMRLPLKGDIFFTLIGITMQTIWARHCAHVFDDIPFSVDNRRKVIIRRIKQFFFFF
jgi:hypothetical protein